MSKIADFLVIVKKRFAACFVIMVSFGVLEASPYAAWMKVESDHAKISELTILGTHNACALHGGDYGACQSLELKAQLELGVRFLDIRCQWKDDDLHIVHGIADQKMRFSEVMDICQTFLDENPSEMLLMSIKEQHSQKRKAGDFGKTFKRILKDGKRKSSWLQQKKLPTLGEGRGKIVVVSRNNEIDGIPWGVFQIQDKFWINKKQSIGQKWQAIIKHFGVIKELNKPSINFTSCTGVFNPPNFTASKVNPKLIRFLLNKKNQTQVLGIVLVDFVTAEMAQAMYGK